MMFLFYLFSLTYLQPDKPFVFEQDGFVIQCWSQDERDSNTLRFLDRVVECLMVNQYHIDSTYLPNGKQKDTFLLSAGTKQRIFLSDKGYFIDHWDGNLRPVTVIDWSDQFDFIWYQPTITITPIDHNYLIVMEDFRHKTCGLLCPEINDVQWDKCEQILDYH